MVISYENYETNLRRVSKISYEMATSVKFCLSYDHLKWEFIAFIMMIISLRKRIVDTDGVNNVTRSHHLKCYYTCGHTNFMTRHYLLNIGDVK